MKLATPQLSSVKQQLFHYTHRFCVRSVIQMGMTYLGLHLGYPERIGGSATCYRKSPANVQQLSQSNRIYFQQTYQNTIPISEY